MSLIFVLIEFLFHEKKWKLILMFWLTVLHEEAADETEEVELMELWLLLRVLRGCWLWCSSTCLEARFIFILGIKRIQRSSPNATSKQNPILEGIQVCLVRWQSGLKFKKIVQFRGSLYSISLEDKVNIFVQMEKPYFQTGSIWFFIPTVLVHCYW